MCHFGIAEVPGAPGKPEITNIRDTSLTLNWTAPTDDGGCKIDGYIVEYCVEGSGNWDRPSTELIPDRDFVVRKLTTGASYEFRVAAKNKAGLGKFSSSTKPIKAAEPLGKKESMQLLLAMHFVRRSFGSKNKIY